jgi:hypothetical protein
MRNRPTFATSFAAFSEARPDLTQLAGKLLMKMDNSSYVSTPSRPYARSNFPKAGATQPERKVSYLLAAQGTPYVAGAGIYDPTATIEVLDKLSGD